MTRIDNDETKGLARPFLILAHVRTGGTFLAHALSNHPDVFCDRGETLHHLSSWRQAGIGAVRLARAMWTMDGYQAAGFRAIYRQAFHEKVWPVIVEHKPHIIHLTRENVARQGVSYGYQQLVRQGSLPYHPVHSFQQRTPAPVEIDPAEIVAYAVKVRAEMAAGAERLATYNGRVLEISYEEMVRLQDGFVHPEVTERIEQFLNLVPAALSASLARDFPRPMRDWFRNWGDVRRALKRAGFGGLNG